MGMRPARAMRSFRLDFRPFHRHIGKQALPDLIIRQLLALRRVLPYLRSNEPKDACPSTVRMVLVPFPAAVRHRRPWVCEVGSLTSSTEARLAARDSRFSSGRDLGTLTRSTGTLTTLPGSTGGTNRTQCGNSTHDSTHGVLVNLQASRRLRREMPSVRQRLMTCNNNDSRFLSCQSQMPSLRG